MGRALPILKSVKRDDDNEHVALRHLAGQIKGEVRLGKHDRMLYATDASMYQVEPIAVVIPASLNDAVTAQRFCWEHNLAVLPRGGGTSLAGQCVNRAVVIDFSPYCRKVHSVSEADKRCHVEPGVTIDELNTELAPTRRSPTFARSGSTERQPRCCRCTHRYSRADSSRGRARRTIPSGQVPC